MKDLAERIAQTHNLTPAMRREFRAIHVKHREMAKEDDPHPSKTLINRFMCRTNGV
jgi:hypothetical protein